MAHPENDTSKNQKERIPLNAYTEEIINGTRYKVQSIFVGDKDFRQMIEDLIVAKAEQHENRNCEEKRDVV